MLLEHYMETCLSLHNRKIVSNYVHRYLSCCMFSSFVYHSASVQVCSPAGQLRHVSEGREKVPVRLVQWRRKVYASAPLPSHQPLHHPLAEPVQQECQVHQPTHHWGQCPSSSVCASCLPTHLMCNNQLQCCCTQLILQEYTYHLTALIAWYDIIGDSDDDADYIVRIWFAFS